MMVYRDDAIRHIFILVGGSMTTEYEIARAMSADIAGILELQEQNQANRGGTLSVALPRAWFEKTLAEMPVIVARSNERVVGFLVSSTLAAYAGVAVVEAMLQVYPARNGAYVYGPICVAASERGRGLAEQLFAALRLQLPGREGILFIRRDNVASLKAHLKMGVREVAEFTHGGIVHAVLAYN
jgi:L-amino acid N-acyltransferase YncA